MKFSIRDLLLLTVIVALALGWWLDSRRSALILRQVLQEQELERKKVRDDLRAKENAWMSERSRFIREN